MSIRITGGKHKGRLLQTPTGLKIRPTQARLRESIFNQVQSLTPDATVADIFAGTGALGFEALSRGAKKAIFLEESKEAVKLIQKNAKTLEVESRCQILWGQYDKQLGKLLEQGPFDLIFADPPYDQGHELKLVKLLGEKESLAAGGRLYIESSSRTKALPEKAGWMFLRQCRKYGDTVLWIYGYGEETDSEPDPLDDDTEDRDDSDESE